MEYLNAFQFLPLKEDYYLVKNQKGKNCFLWWDGRNFKDINNEFSGSIESWLCQDLNGYFQDLKQASNGGLEIVQCGDDEFGFKIGERFTPLRATKNEALNVICILKSLGIGIKVGDILNEDYVK